MTTRHCNAAAFLAVLGGAALASCDTGSGSKLVASVYVESQLVRAAEGGTLEISAAEDSELAGTRVIIPAHALAADTVVTLTRGRHDIAVPGAVPAGPVVALGPADAVLALPVTLTVPVRPVPPATLVRVFTRTNDDTISVLLPPAIDLDPTGGVASFAATSFKSFQGGRADDVCTGESCDAGEVCRNGGCWQSCASSTAPFTHVLFVVDQSNSMTISDPTGGRLAAMADVVQSFMADPSTQTLKPDVAFAVVGFWGDVATYTKDAGGNPGFSQNGAEVMTALTKLSTLAANTDFANALAAADSLIDRRLESLSATDRARANFQLVFISDGLPFPDNCVGEGNSVPVARRWVTILRDKAAYRGIELTLHTVLVIDSSQYAAPMDAATRCCLGLDQPPLMLMADCRLDAQAPSAGDTMRALAQAMAAAGGGTFTTFSETSPADLSGIDFTPPVTAPCPAGYVCEVADGLCVPHGSPRSSSCQTDSDCALGWLCRANLCLPDQLGCGDDCALAAGDVLKTVFVIDDSGSMQFSDPSHVRMAAMSAAINTLADRAQAAGVTALFAAVKFNTSATITPTYAPASAEAVFTDNLVELQDAAAHPQTDGLSDVQGALGFVQQMLAKDVSQATQDPFHSAQLERTHYQIVLLTDGLPDPTCSMGPANDHDQVNPGQPYLVCESSVFLSCLLKRPGTVCDASSYGTCSSGAAGCSYNGETPYCCDQGDTAATLLGGTYSSELEAGYDYNQPYQLVQKVERIVAMQETVSVASLKMHTILISDPSLAPDVVATFGDPAAAAPLIQEMAHVGHGAYMEFTSAADIDFLQPGFLEIP